MLMNKDDSNGKVLVSDIQAPWNKKHTWMKSHLSTTAIFPVSNIPKVQFYYIFDLYIRITSLQ